MQVSHLHQGDFVCSLAEEKGQDLNRQVRELKEAGAEEIITEREHGDAKVKQNLDLLLEVAEEDPLSYVLSSAYLNESSTHLHANLLKVLPIC